MTRRTTLVNEQPGLMTFRACPICGQRFWRIDPDYRSGRYTRVFCSDCIDAVHRGENPQADGSRRLSEALNVSGHVSAPVSGLSGRRSDVTAEVITMTQQIPVDALKRFFEKRGYGRYDEAVAAFYAAHPEYGVADPQAMADLRTQAVKRLKRVYDEADRDPSRRCR
jgi:hypothetical protein